ncbi:hypothetical protein EVAR_98197_1 [Eumeta japonica]|uniref:Uncharacterized protein n=1 Tax=Eumeta variegata TaxID=151549 RepID=A0A4C1Y7T9_EUMVA|nr:hypothetical protein EVAR_98197_1 [Eumeta japonica]
MKLFKGFVVCCWIVAIDTKTMYVRGIFKIEKGQNFRKKQEPKVRGFVPQKEKRNSYRIFLLSVRPPAGASVHLSVWRKCPKFMRALKRRPAEASLEAPRRYYGY